MKSDPIKILELGSWRLKIREPRVVENAPVVVLIHGWTGDENSMWVFANDLSMDALIIAPRGLYPSRHEFKDGYSWAADTSKKWASKEDFADSVERLNGLFDQLAGIFPANFEQLNLVGFSQGSAMVTTYIVTHPERVTKLAMLSGFLPEGTGTSDADLAGKRVFIGHGSLDDVVPQEKAEEASLLFQALGAEVDLCVTEVGHRLGKDCFRGFNRFFQNL